MAKSIYTPSEIKYLWKHRGNKLYELKCLKTEGNDTKILFEDRKNYRQVSGKIVASPHEGEAYHWSRLKHDNLAPLLDIVSINERVSIYISTVFEQSLQCVIHEREFIERPDCMYRKKTYTEDILWALDYLHSKRLSLMNLNDANIYISRAKDKAIITDFSCLMLAERAKKSEVAVPLMYRAPELDLQSSESFDAIAAEMWACGAMMLQIFTGHIMSCFEKDASHILKAVDSINVAVLISSNAGDRLITNKTVSDLTKFLDMFFKMEPKNRTTAENAAISHFLQNKHYSTDKHENKFKELKSEELTENNSYSNEGNSKPNLIRQVITPISKHSYSALKTNLKKLSPKYFLSLQYGSNQQKTNDEIFRLSLRDYEHKSNVQALPKCKLSDESIKPPKNLRKDHYELFNTGNGYNQFLMKSAGSIYPEPEIIDIKPEKEISKQNLDCPNQIPSKIQFNKQEKKIMKSIDLNTKLCSYNTSTNLNDILAPENILPYKSPKCIQGTQFRTDPEIKFDNIQLNNLNKRTSAIESRNMENIIHYGYNIPIAKRGVLFGVKSASDSFLSPNRTATDKSIANLFYNKNNSDSEIILLKTYSIINPENDLLLNPLQSYSRQEHADVSSYNNSECLKNPPPEPIISNGSYFNERRNMVESCFNDLEQILFYRSGERIDNSERNHTLKRKTIFEDSNSHPFTLSSLYIGKFIQNNPNFLCNTLNENLIEVENQNLEQILKEDRCLNISEENTGDNKVNVNSCISVSLKTEKLNMETIQTNIEQIENIDPNTELLASNYETNFSFCRRYSYERAMSAQVKSNKITKESSVLISNLGNVLIHEIPHTKKTKSEKEHLQADAIEKLDSSTISAISSGDCNLELLPNSENPCKIKFFSHPKQFRKPKVLKNGRKRNKQHGMSWFQHLCPGCQVYSDDKEELFAIIT